MKNITKKVIVFQIDSIKLINFIEDSTFTLMKEGYVRKNRIFFYLPKNLNLINGNVVAKGFYIYFKKKS